MRDNLRAGRAALLFLVASATVAMAASDGPALPRCKPVGDHRTPVAVWEPGYTRDGTLSSVPPQGKGRVVYMDLVTGPDYEACAGPEQNGVFAFEVPSGTPGLRSGSLHLTILEPKMKATRGGCHFNGFYVNEPVHSVEEGRSETSFRPLDTMEVMTSGRYCRADAKLAARWSESDQLSQATVPPLKQRDFLSICRPFGEGRMAISVWAPKVNKHSHVSSVPPQGYGRLVYVSIVADYDCAGAWQDQYYTLTRPNDKKEATYGGLEISLRGNIRSEKGHCVWSGLFMTGLFQGWAMGWAATSFISVDENKVATSGQYCLARRHGPLRRPSARR